MILRNSELCEKYGNTSDRQLYERIHQRMLLDALNLSLSLERPHYIKSQMEPWACPHFNPSGDTHSIESLIANPVKDTQALESFTRAL